MSKNPKQTENQKQTASNLKETFGKLNEEVNKLGAILGMKGETNAAPGAKDSKEITKSGDKNEYHKEVTAEDKKARKAAKAAEKKARAEKSIAGKAAGPTGNAQQKKQEQPAKKQDQSTPQKPGVPPSEVNSKFSDDSKILEQAVEQLTTDLKTVSIGQKEDLKSAIKNTNGVKKNVRHVHNVLPPHAVTFDISRNTVQTMANVSESDEAVTTEMEAPVITQLEDASSFAHVHPAFLTLLAMADKEKLPDVETVCIEFINAFKKFLGDWTAEREKKHGDHETFSHDLDLAIRPQLAHLTQNGHWPLPFALGNIVRLLKRTIKRLSETSNSKCEESLQLYLEDTLTINFSAAYNAISQLLVRKLRLYKKVVVFDWCPVVNRVMLDAREQMPDLLMTVIDVNNRRHGIRHVKSFIDRNYQVKYFELSAASWASLDGSVLVLGCSAIFANGAVAVPRGGLATVLCANHFNIPVIVVAEHFKFIDKGQVNPRVALLGRQNIEFVPSDLVTAVVTDLRILGPTSAPAVLKAKALTDMA